MRTDGRKNNQLREVKIIPEVNRHAEGSVRIEVGNTIIICTASVEESIPKWLMGTGKGWISAEYGMLPRSTHSRIKRDKAANSGRTQEISRLIGRSLRAAVDLVALGERQVYVDCDVIQADGGTRTAAITGGFVALCLALQYIKDKGKITAFPVRRYVAAISVGLSHEGSLLDLNYDEDSNINTDMNFVINNKGNFIEVQGTAEGMAFSMDQLNEMIELAQMGCRELFQKQHEVLKDILKLDL